MVCCVPDTENVSWHFLNKLLRMNKNVTIIASTTKKKKKLLLVQDCNSLKKL